MPQLLRYKPPVVEDLECCVVQWAIVGGKTYLRRSIMQSWLCAGDTKESA